jgi:UDP-glucose 4-epimerase
MGHRYLVTGGAGFIGSELVNFLITNKNDIIVIDNLSVGNRENVNPKSEFVNGDVRDKNIIKNIPDLEKIFHLAAQKDVRCSILKPEEDFDINVNGTLNMLELARKNDCEFIFFSTAAVYGESNKPLKESSKKNPKSPYGINKLKVENLCLKFKEKYGLKVSIIRPFNVYGPKKNQNDSDVITKFITSILRNQPIVIYGDGEQKRDFIHVRDVVNAAANIKEGIFNVASGKSITVNDLSTLIMTISNKKVEIKHEKSNENEIKISIADISKIKKIGWKPAIKLEDGIKEIIEFQNNLL